MLPSVKLENPNLPGFGTVPVSREIDPSDYAPKEFIVQSSDREISWFSQRFLAVSKMFAAVVS